MKKCTHVPILPVQVGLVESAPPVHVIVAEPTKVYPGSQDAVYCSPSATVAVLGITLR